MFEKKGRTLLAKRKKSLGAIDGRTLSASIRSIDEAFVR
uniref:Uncharacterized protein n=1 Tax=Brassica oleracea TaxID=3712 RepID=A0A3P6GUG4_BRAOL|nr:unnamed protein product [Brassica oleracea]